MGYGLNRNPFIGGDERDRTVDLCVANASLSQLSYTPNIYPAGRLALARSKDVLFIP